MVETMARYKTDNGRPKTHGEDPIRTLREAAIQFGKSSQTIGRWVHDGLLRVIRHPSGMPGIRQSEIDAFLGGSALGKQRTTTTEDPDDG